MDLLGADEKVPRYLVDWISNFIHTRQIALAYPGSPRTSNKVDRGIPHGSPLSPLLFVIYVRALHPGNRTIGYIYIIIRGRLLNHGSVNKFVQEYKNTGREDTEDE